MTFNCVDVDGNALFGDRQVDDGMKAMCDAVNGVIVDDQTGKVVYPVDGQMDKDIVYPLPAPEVEYAVVEDNIVAVDEGEIVDVVVELEMADIPPAPVEPVEGDEEIIIVFEEPTDEDATEDE